MSGLVTLKGHGLGYRRHPDRPELPILASAAAPLAAFPAVVDLRHLFRPAFDQRNYSTCTCNGAAAQLDAELVRQRVPVVADRSRSYPYYYSGLAEGDTGDVGRDPHFVFQAMADHGDCLEKDWGYYPNVQMGQEPSPAAQKAAARRKYTGWSNVNRDIFSIKTALVQGYTVGIAFAVYASFEDGNTLRTGIVPIPGPNEWLAGYHYMVIGGYTDVALPEGIPANSLIVLNSWGLGVGHQGWMFFPYNFITALGKDGNNLVLEMIALQQVTP